MGRPNVGKSTLFNALTRTRDALVQVEPGVTRDRNYGVCRLDEARPFVLVDTGGIAGENIHLESGGLAGATARQARAAAAEADLVLFVVDGREGASALDDDILRWLRKVARPVFLVVNKTDGIDARAALAEFARYGFNDVLAISSAHRQGIDELLAKVLAKLPADGDAQILDEDPERIRIAFVGRPNVGKSTLTNALVGAKVSIVSPRPQTTRHRLLGIATFADGQLLLVDTPGLHRDQGKSTATAMHRWMNRAARGALEGIDAAMLVVRAGQWDEADDFAYQALHHVGVPVVLVVNQVDRLKDKTALLPYLAKITEGREFAGVHPISALKRKGLEALTTDVLALLPEQPALYAE
ncbi:MAG: GTPase Era, partial [Pseudonocardia sp.]